MELLNIKLTTVLDAQTCKRDIRKYVQSGNFAAPTKSTFKFVGELGERHIEYTLCFERSVDAVLARMYL
jgi:hypothetical protein